MWDRKQNAYAYMCVSNVPTQNARRTKPKAINGNEKEEARKREEKQMRRIPGEEEEVWEDARERKH